MQKYKQNTFGNYKFEKWVPKHTRDLIRNFWGQMGRTHQDWLGSCHEQNTREFCQHGPGPNGFGMPPMGAMVEYFIYDLETSRELGKCLFKSIEGRYIHLWNNMGSLIDEDGKTYFVSTCDRWVRLFVDQK